MLCLYMNNINILRAARGGMLFFRSGVPPFPGSLRAALFSERDRDIFGVADIVCVGEGLMQLRNYTAIHNPGIPVSRKDLTPIFGPLARLDKGKSLEVSSRLEALHARAQERSTRTDINEV